MARSPGDVRLGPLGVSVVAAIAALGAAALVFVLMRPIPTWKEILLVKLENDVIRPGYARFAEAAGRLRAEAAALARDPSRLERAREAWREARQAWGRCEAHLVGPEIKQFLFMKFDMTPLFVGAIEDLLRREPLDLRQVGADRKGFAAIEELLWGKEVGGRRGELLVALAVDLEEVACQIRDLWDPDKGAFGARWRRNSEAAMDDVVNRLVMFVETTKDQRLGLPLGMTRITDKVNLRLDFVESRRSGNGVRDLLSDLEGVERVYEVLGPKVVGAAPEVDENIRRVLRKAREDVAAIPGPLDVAMVQQLDRVMNAYISLRQLRNTLSVELVSSFEATLRFSAFDGD